MVLNNTFKCTATGKYYKGKGIISYISINVVYLITCQCCKLQLEQIVIAGREILAGLVKF